ncbi:MAG: hypothetical protein A3H71_03230 [Candidatus Sungbacteria bacterium RIFCSPLOWO2_02_FULL_48_13b]|uniref:DUF4921 domain-containing protein n=2 Tax=Candidatus Sungiibacteriota TaxID=1817917 RepID=A0A1G2LH30_9BACT|nr:MAG: hypothetical protein A3C12_00240 [Candidatus Sungbacteria bacterium RIFCSPHIGHO2_02_FULL_49_20]OHA10936.1 MAG: hypothetical protein A3H71_03230 [Candidatus Sungbacteria bacterium RIFCSPLOWO2_02_FULL_48_13b]
MSQSNNRPNYSELRRDIVSGDWVVIATGRARRPDEFISNTPAVTTKDHIKDCPFESLEDGALLIVTNTGELLMASMEEGKKAKDWAVEVMPNKFPAFAPHQDCPALNHRGPYEMIDGVGFHEVIVMRPHARPIALQTPKEVELLIRAYRSRFKTLDPEACVKYISILHNHGHEAGASIVHPHSQLIAIPVVPPDVSRSLAGSERYFADKKSCVHCVMIEFERKEKERLVFENDHFVGFAPYVSRAAFEVRIFPKLHSPEFQNISEEEIPSFAEALQTSLARLHFGLNNPSYNFFLHTSPVDGDKGYGHYHWHVEILPKTSTWGGFEFGTGIKISTIMPEDAAAFLRDVKIPHQA